LFPEVSKFAATFFAVGKIFMIDLISKLPKTVNAETALLEFKL
jgi:hypothetical protein